MALTNVFQAGNIKNTSPKCHFTYIVLQMFSLWAPPMILLTAGVLTDPQLPARASNVYTTDARLGGIGWVASAGWHRPGGIDRVASTGWNRPGGIGRVPPPKQKSWLRRCSRALSSEALHVVILLDEGSTFVCSRQPFEEVSSSAAFIDV